MSLAAQAEQIQTYAKLYKHTLVDIERDEASGASWERPGLRSCLERLARGEAEAVIVVRLDRLCRSLAVLSQVTGELERAKAGLVSIAEHVDTTTAAGRLVLGVLVAVSQWEREAIVERTKGALAHLRRKGVHLGTCPYGYRRTDSGSLEPDPAEQEALRLASDARSEGLSLRRICALLDARGYLPRRGGGWRPESLRGALEGRSVETR